MTAFCKKCGCVSDDDSSNCVDCGGDKKEVETMNCGHLCNGVCQLCGQAVVHVTMLLAGDQSEIVAMNPELEHGGNVEIRPNKSGKLFAKETGPDPEQTKFIVHSIACIGRKPYSRSDAMVPSGNSRVEKCEDSSRRRTWAEERADMIQEALRKLQ